MTKRLSDAPAALRGNATGALAPALKALELARIIEARWHAMGHTNVRVWTRPNLCKVKWLSRTGVLVDSEIHTHEIVSNLVNGMPPAATEHDKIPCEGRI